MIKKLVASVAFIAAVIAFSISAFAASYSSAWYQNGGNWYIKGPQGNMVTSAWVCDNSSGPGSSDSWYLIDSNGAMVTHPLVQDGTGNYYSLETAHNGNYGMLRHINGTYDGVPLTFNQSHGGSFGAITNQDGINALKAKYGCYNVAHINNNNCIYTSSYSNKNSSSSKTSNTSKEYRLSYYVDGSKWKTVTSSSNSIKTASYNSLLMYWYDEANDETYYPGEYYHFSGSSTSAKLEGVFSGQDPYAGTTVNQYTLVLLQMGDVYKTMTNSTGSFKLPSCSSVNGNQFAYWMDEYGYMYYPGQMYYSHSYDDYLEACYYETNYGDDSDYYE